MLIPPAYAARFNAEAALDFRLMVALAEAGRAFAADAKLELGVLIRKYRDHSQKLEQLRQILRQIYRVG